MKNRNLTLILLLITTSIFGQIPKNAISIEDKNFNDYFQNKKNIPVVKGKIINLSEDEIKVTKINYVIVTPFNVLQINKSCKPNIDGTFELELEHAFPYQQIWLSVGKAFYAGIYANTELFIELDAEKLKSSRGLQYNGDGVKYLGTDGELNSYLNNHVLFQRNKQLDISRALSTLRRDRLDSDAYILKYDSLYSILNELDNEFIKQNPSEYGWIIWNERQSAYYGNLCVRYWGKEIPLELFDKIKNHKPYIVSNEGMIFYNCLFNYLSNIPEKAQRINFKTYQAYSKLGQTGKSQLDSILLLEKDMDQNKVYDTTKYVKLIRSANIFLRDTFLSERTLQITKRCDSIFEPSKADLLKIHLSNEDPNEQKIMMEAVLINVQTKWCKEIIEKQYENSLSKLASIKKILNESKTFNTDDLLGEPIAQMPFGAKLYKVDAMDCNILLANLKNANKDKALIIDFWATWCGPCLLEMPYSKKLHDASKDLRVEFVYLCTSSNSDIDKWKAKIAEFEIGGTHIFVEQEIENKLMTLFSVSGFPSYVFIDKKGDYKPGAIKRMSMLDKHKLTELTN